MLKADNRLAHPVQSARIIREEGGAEQGRINQEQRFLSIGVLMIRIPLFGVLYQGPFLGGMAERKLDNWGLKLFGM